MSNEIATYRPINSDLSTAMEWCSARNEQTSPPSLRVTSGDRLYLRSVARKNTDDTCWIVKAFNAIIRVFIEGFRCCRPGPTAERLIQITSQSLQQEIDTRLEQLSNKVNKMIQKSESTKKQPIEQVKRLKEVIENETQQLDALVRSGEQLINAMSQHRLNGNADGNLNQARQEQFQNAIQPLLTNLSQVNERLKSSIVTPLDTFVLSHEVSNTAVEAEELLLIFNSAMTTMTSHQEEQTTDDENETSTSTDIDPLVSIRMQGLDTHCDFALVSTFKSLHKEMASVGKLIQKAQTGLDKIDQNHPLAHHFSIQALQSLITRLDSKWSSLMGNREGAKQLIEALSVQVHLEENGQVEGLLQKHLSTIDKPLQLLKNMIIQPLQTYLSIVKRGDAPIDGLFLSNIFSSLEDIANKWKDVGGNIAIDKFGFILSYVLELSARADLQAAEYLPQIGTHAFWKDEGISAEALTFYRQKAEELYITFTGYRSPSPTVEEISSLGSEGDSFQERPSESSLNGDLPQ